MSLSRTERLSIPKLSHYRDNVTVLESMRKLLKSTRLGVGASHEASGSGFVGSLPTQNMPVQGASLKASLRPARLRSAMRALLKKEQETCEANSTYEETRSPISVLKLTGSRR